MILAASAAGVILALVLLFVRVAGSPSVEIPDEAVEQARKRHERRNQASRMRAASIESTSRPRERSTGTSGTITASRGNQQRSGRDTGASSDDKPSRHTLQKALSGKGADEDSKSVDFDTRMQEANKLYDRRDYEGALGLAKELLQETPGNVRMLRVAVSSACMMGDEQTARAYHEQLPARHQLQMQRRCERYGVTLAVNAE